jgi:hypothetical protein
MGSSAAAALLFWRENTVPGGHTQISKTPVVLQFRFCRASAFVMCPKYF